MAKIWLAIEFFGVAPSPLSQICWNMMMHIYLSIFLPNLSGIVVLILQNIGGSSLMNL